jgi:amino acid transporter
VPGARDHGAVSISPGLWTAGLYDHAVGRTGAHAYRGPRRRRFPPDIERIVRHRRWWAWTAVAALAAVAVFAGTGPVHGVLVALGLVMWVAAVCLVGAGTFRLRRRGVYTVGFLDAPFSPVRRRAARLGRSDPPEWLVRAIIGVAVLGCLAVTLPDQVNAVAYLTDSTSTAVFLPRSYVQDCGKDGCTTRTAGILEGSGLPAVWPAEVPLDRPFLVQAPVWRAGSNPTLMTSNPAIGYTLLAMIIDVAAVSTLSGYVLRLRRRLRSRERPGWRGAAG